MGRSKFFVPDQKFIYILWQSKTFCARQKNELHLVKLVYVPAQKFFEEALNAVKFLGWLKKFGSAQNILGTVKGLGTSFILFEVVENSNRSPKFQFFS